MLIAKPKKLFGAGMLCLMLALIAPAAVMFSSCAYTDNSPGGGSSSSSEFSSDTSSDVGSSEDGADGTGGNGGVRVPIGGNAEVGDY